MEATGSIVAAAAAQLHPSYSPGGANVHPILYGFLNSRESAPANGTSIGSSVFAGLTAGINPDRPRTPLGLQLSILSAAVMVRFQLSHKHGYKIHAIN